MRTVATIVGAILLAVGAPATAPTTTPAATDRADRRANVRVSVERGRKLIPCPEVDTTRPYVRGGCTSRGHDMAVDVGVRTALGRLPFAWNCSISFDFHVGHDGRTWMDRLLIGGVRGGCGDIRPCEPNALEPSRHDPSGGSSPVDFRPWRGRLHWTMGGPVVNVVDVCVDTCAGRYDGRLELSLTRQGQGWTLGARRRPIGRSGLTVDGEWRLDGRGSDLQIESSRPSAPGHP